MAMLEIPLEVWSGGQLGNRPILDSLLGPLGYKKIPRRNECMDFLQNIEIFLSIRERVRHLTSRFQYSSS